MTHSSVLRLEGVFSLEEGLVLRRRLSDPFGRPRLAGFSTDCFYYSFFSFLHDLRLSMKEPILILTESFTHSQLCTKVNTSFNHLGNAKLTASAMLNPELKPAWYPRDLVTINSPSLWMVLVILIPLDRIADGWIIVVLCRRYYEHFLNPS